MTLNFLIPNYCYCFGRHCFCVDVRGDIFISIFYFVLFCFIGSVAVPQYGSSHFQPLCTFSTVSIVVSEQFSMGQIQMRIRIYTYVYIKRKVLLLLFLIKTQLIDYTKAKTEPSRLNCFNFHLNCKYVNYGYYRSFTFPSVDVVIVCLQPSTAFALSCMG